MHRQIKTPSRRHAMVLSALALTLVPSSGLGGESPTTRIVAVGDSLTAGYGLPVAESFPAQLEITLNRMGYKVEVINAGVSGDTTSGALARLDWVLADKPDIALVCLGANDGLRAISPTVTRANMARLLERLRMAGVAVLLSGMRAPPNLGLAYTESFDNIFPDLAKQNGVVFYPFFLDGVATIPRLNQADGIHPNREGVQIIVSRIQPLVADMLQRRG